MFYDFSLLWIWLVLTALVGGAVGWRTEASGPQQPWFEGWPRYALIALAVAFVLALFGLFPGRAGLWLESAVWFVIAYLIGCLAGGAARRARDPV